MSPAQIAADLRGRFRGPLHFDPARRAVYAADAGPFAVEPVGVACPVDVADVRTLLGYARSVGLPVVPRGAGTGTAGGCVGPGLVIDLSVNLRAVKSRPGGFVTAEAGVTVGELVETLAKVGRRLAGIGTGRPAGTIGGRVMAGGVGSVARLEVVWDDGSFDCLPVGEFKPSDRLIESRSQTAALLAGNRELIQLARPAGGGYRLHGALTPAGLDLARLLCGSGGTLGVLTAVTLPTAPLPGGECRAVVGFPSLEAAVQAGLALTRTDGLTGCELLDGRYAAAARSGVPASVGAVLLLAWEATSPTVALQRGRTAVDGLRGRHVFLPVVEPTADTDGRRRVIDIQTAAVANLHAVCPGRRPQPGCDDIGLPLHELAGFLHAARGIAQQAGITIALTADIAAGVVRLRPLLDLLDPADRAKFWPLADALHTHALGRGGSVGPTHGAGIARTPWVAAQAGPLADLFADLKRVFDPAGVLNPGQIVGPDPSRPAWPLRRATSDAPKPVGRIELVTRHSSLVTCNSCGACRPRTGPGRSCPTHRAGGDETATPRAKAELVMAGVDPTGEAARAVAGLCVHCKMCPKECPAGVDVPGLAVALKAAYFAAHGLPRGAWLPARIDGLSRLAGAFAFTANTLLESGPARWLLEKTVGLDRRRRLPRLTHRTFLRRAVLAGWHRPPKPLPGAVKVAYFVDTFANRHDPLVGLATVAVLRHAGVAVQVPWRQTASGLAPLVAGDREAARELAGYNVRTLAPLVRDGFQVVCSEPAAAVALTQEYPGLLDTPDARLVADHTVELMTLLERRRVSGALPADWRPTPLAVGVHVPCHVKALGEPVSARLLDTVPGLDVMDLADGCSGMAGPWGLTARNAPTSFAAGRVMLDSFRAGPAVGVAECSACRLQMQDATGKRAVHPVVVLAHAYGLLPAAGRRLRRLPGKRLTDG